MTTSPRRDAADPLLAKVRKLLALAEDPAATQHEAETYTAKAAQLIADYGIDQALLAASGAAGATDAVGDRVLVVPAPYAVDKADLLASVAVHLRCRAVRRTRWVGERRELSLHLFGHRSDLDRTELLYTSLLVQATHGLTRARAPRHEHLAAFRRSWLAGFREAVSERLRESEVRAHAAAEGRFREQGTSAALVLADRSAEVEQALADAYPSLGHARPRRLSGSGAIEGWGAGRRADLGSARLGGGRRALPRG
ncbi:MAG: DUF2786 domain-containing protein [Nocardioides sp.]